jgi:hypothetical protein
LLAKCTGNILRYLAGKNSERFRMDQNFEEMSDNELRAEHARLRDDLCDLEDMHSYTGKTTVHIGGEKARAMQEEFEEDCRELKAQIENIEKELKARGIA